MKATIIEIKNNPEETNRGRKEAGIPTNDLEDKEEMNIESDKKKKQEFKKMRRGLATSRTTLNRPTSESERCQKKMKKEKLKTNLKK